MGDENLSFEEVLSDPEYNFDRVVKKVEEEVLRLDEMLRSASEEANRFFEKTPSFEPSPDVDELKAQLQNIDFQYNRLKTLLEAKKAVVHLSAAADEHLMKVELANAMRVAAESKADKDIANAEARHAVEMAKANAEREAVIKKAEADKRAVAAEHAAKVLKAKLEANKVFVGQLDLAIGSLKAVADESVAGTLFEKLTSCVEEIEKMTRQPSVKPPAPPAAEVAEYEEPEVAEPAEEPGDYLETVEKRIHELQEEMAEQRITEEAYRQALEDLLKAEEQIAAFEETKEQLRIEISERQKVQEQHKEILEYVLKAEERIGNLEESNEQLQREIAERHKTQEQHRDILENLLKAEERIAELQEANDQLQREMAEHQITQEQHREVLESLLKAEERIAELQAANNLLQREIVERMRPEEAHLRPPTIDDQEAPELEPMELREEWFPKYKEEPSEPVVAEQPEPLDEELEEAPVTEIPEQPEVWSPEYQAEAPTELGCFFCSAPSPEFREAIGAFYCSVCGYVWRP